MKENTTSFKVLLIIVMIVAGALGTICNILLIQAQIFKTHSTSMNVKYSKPSSILTFK